MIAITNIAFDFLRKHKQVSEEVEKLVLQKVKNRVSNTELVTIFENGISGQYGKVYSLDAATLIGWVNQYQASKSKSVGTLGGNLLNPNIPTTSAYYPQSYKDWQIEVNKAYTAYLSGVSETEFHPDIYQRLMCDIPARIELGAIKKYVPDDYWLKLSPAEINKAMQLCIRDYFAECKSRGWDSVYKCD